jgi:hypothetical protein
LVERVVRFDAKERWGKWLRGVWGWLAFFDCESGKGRNREILGGWASGKRLASRGGVTEKWQTKKWKLENDIREREANVRCWFLEVMDVCPETSCVLGMTIAERSRLIAAVIQHASQSSFNTACAIIRKPRQQRRLLMRNLGIRLLVQNFGQYSGPTLAGSHSKNNLTIHGCFIEKFLIAGNTWKNVTHGQGLL